MKLFAHSNGHDFEVEISPDRDRLLLRVGGREIPLSFDDQKASIRTAFLGDRRLDFGWDRDNGSYRILIDGIEYDVVVRDPKAEQVAKVAESGQGAGSAAAVRAPIPGLISKVLLQAGQEVRKDQTVLCLDAMKLENEIAAPRDGVLKSVEVAPGQAVEKGQTLFVVE
jgi:biotin carboxyl carrier protein